MKKNLRKGMISVLSVFALSVAAGAFAVSNNAVASAQQTSPFTWAGASIRPSDNEYGVGLRFKAEITKAQYDENKGDGSAEVFYGMRFKAEGSDTVVDSAANGGKSLKVTFDDEQDTSGELIGAVVDFNEYNLTRPYQAQVYYKVGENEEVASAWSDPRAYFTVATQAIADATEDREDLKATLQADVDKITDSANAGSYAISDVTVTVEGKTDLNALASGDVITVNATASNGTNSLDVYPVVSITSSTGASMGTFNGLKQVAGTQNQYTVDFAYASQFKVQAKVGSCIEEVEAQVVSGKSGANYMVTENGDGSITLAGGSVYGINSAGNPNAGLGLGTNYAFYGLGAYDSEKKIVVEFTGANIPNVALFTDSVNGQAAGGGKGLFIQTSSVSSSWNGRTNVLGPYRFDAGNPNLYTTYQSSATEGKNSQLGQDISADAICVNRITEISGYETMKFRYTVGSQATASAVTAIDLKLEKEVADGWELVKSKTITVSNATMDKLGTYAMVYGTSNKALTLTSVKVEDAFEWTNISNAEDLAKLGTATTGYYRLTNNIDMTGKSLVQATSSFSGILDGQGFAISNLNISTSSGLFATLSNAQIRNIKFVDATSGANQCGILAHTVGANVSLKNVFIGVNLGIKQLAGGICKYLNGTLEMENVIIVASSHNDTNVIAAGNGRNGFISGEANKSSKVVAKNCSFTADVNAYASGLRPQKDINYNASYYNAVWSDNATYTCLASSADDTQYSNFISGTYKVNVGGTAANYASVKKYFEETVYATLDTTLQALYGTVQNNA